MDNVDLSMSKSTFKNGNTTRTSSKMNSEVYRALVSTSTLLNATELISRPFTVQIDNDHKHAAERNKGLFESKEMEYSSIAKSVT